MGVHGLPSEYRTPDSEKEGWQATHGYLKALEKSGRPIVVAVSDLRQKELDPHHGSHLTQQIGFLREQFVRDDRPRIHRFALDWPDPDQPCGEFTIDERLFAEARLSTVDGDDYFWLKLDLGSINVLVMDSNANMDHALREWSVRHRQSYLSLPSAAEIEEKLQAEPDQKVLEKISNEAAQLREDLAKAGATVAQNMSDAELLAATERVSWNLRTSGRMSKVHHTEWRQLWFENLVASLRERG